MSPLNIWIGPAVGLVCWVLGYLTARWVEARNRRRRARWYRRPIGQAVMDNLIADVMAHPEWPTCPHADIVNGVRYPCTRPEWHPGGHATPTIRAGHHA